MLDRPPAPAATAATRRPRRAGGYLFLPKRVQRPEILAWLRRTHAWTGAFGALLFVFLGLSGFLLNHRSMLKIDTGAPMEVSRVQEVLAAPLRDEAALAALVAERFGVGKTLEAPRRRGAAPVTVGGADAAQAERWALTASGPNGRIEASYLPAARLLEVVRTENGLLGLMKNLHKGSGVTAAWVLFLDAVAGALILMSLSGVLLWTRLHGPRLAAAAIGAASLLGAALALLPAWL